MVWISVLECEIVKDADSKITFVTVCVCVLNYHWVNIFKYKYNSTTLVSQIGAVYFGTLLLFLQVVSGIVVLLICYNVCIQALKAVYHVYKILYQWCWLLWLIKFKKKLLMCMFCIVSTCWLVDVLKIMCILFLLIPLMYFLC